MTSALEELELTMSFRDLSDQDDEEDAGELGNEIAEGEEAVDGFGDDDEDEEEEEQE